MISPIVGLMLTVLSAMPPTASARDSLLTVYQQDGHIRATVDRRLLRTDFVLRAQVLAVATGGGADARTGAGAAAAPVVGAQRLSGALQLREDGDSLVLMEYTGTSHGQLHYRRRAAMPVLRRVGRGALVVDAASLWATVAPAAPRDVAIGAAPAAWATPMTWAYEAGAPLARVTGGKSYGKSQAALVQSLGRYRVSYGVGFYRLPQEPMRPRIADPRVRINTITVSDSSGDSTKSVQYVVRRRLEKKDPTAAVSDVIQPIIYRIHETVPEALEPAVRQSIEEWIKVLESLGFRNPVVIRTHMDPPPADDETENVISFGEGEAGGTTWPDIDPRTGELTEANVTIFDGTLPLLQGVYFATAGLTDRRARFPFPDTLNGLVMKNTFIHELGHTLGLDHNFKAAGVYPTDSLRQPDFMRRMGFQASIMSYTAFGYVAQPEDHVDAESFRPRIGPADWWTVSWVYRDIPGAATPEDELPTLEQWRAVQDTTYYLRPSLVDGESPSADPYDQSDVLSNDLLKSAQYGIRNFARLAAEVASDTTDAMKGGRAALSYRWATVMQKLSAVIGSKVPRAPYPKKQDEIQWDPIDPMYQLQVVRFLLGQVVGDTTSDMVKQIVGASVASGPDMVLFDVTTPGWEDNQDFLRVVQPTIVSNAIDTGRLKGMIAQMSPAQQQKEIPILCRELKTLEQRLNNALTQSSNPVRKQAAQGILGPVKAALDPKNAVCQ